MKISINEHDYKHNKAVEVDSWVDEFSRSAWWYLMFLNNLCSPI